MDVKEFSYEIEADMLLVRFEDFRKHSAILRSDDPRLNFVTYSEVERGIRENSVLIFVSHRWLSPQNPDSKCNIKHRLICEGIEHIQEIIDDADTQYYVWIDFSCVDQVDVKLREKGIKSLPAYIERADVLLTPIPSDDTLPAGAKRIKYKGCKRLSIRDFGDTITPRNKAELGKYIHTSDIFSRAWIRLEQLIGSNTPVHPSCFNYFKRLDLHRTDRPHFFVTPDREHYNFHHLIVLPKLTKSIQELLDPLKGMVTNKSDMENIWAIKNTLDLCEDNQQQYVGDRNERGEMHGYGTLTYENGAEYKGEFVADTKHGKGVLYYATGDRYEGDFFEDQRCGVGTYFYTNRAVFVGKYKDNKRHGKGWYYPPGRLNNPIEIFYILGKVAEESLQNIPVVDQ